MASDGTCKTCRFWDRPNAMCGKRFVDVNTSERAFKADSLRVWVYYPTSFGTPHVQATFTGPDYGCVHWQEKPFESRTYTVGNWGVI